MPRLDVHFLPDLTDDDDLAGGLVVVIDVLRAGTTICHALAAGAVAVVPCLEVDDARRAAAESYGDPAGLPAVLGGERGGLPIEGFELGNSPADYTPDSVGGRAVVFTTTNGTRAMIGCRRARRVLIGAFVNLSAVAEELAATADRPAHLLCAGTRGLISGEDVLLAGALAATSTASGSRELGNDQARLAQAAWRQVAGEGGHPPAAELAEHLRLYTHGGRNVDALGLADDIRAAATIDRFDFAPELKLHDWRIVRG